jgi:SsrA-binding protein
MQRNKDKSAVATNRKARFDYELGDTWEAGLVLTGTEVKVLREGKCTLGDAYVKIDRGEAFLVNAHIPEYAQGNRNNHEPKRTRKLLLHAGEIEKIQAGIERAGMTCVAVSLYFVKGRAKVEIALARGRKHYDKRGEKAAEADKREMRKFVR